jgi:2,5-diamino-6-(ribosylamino)-4(3H)-pyrimidinone 5'-phosphate reductase
VLRTPGERVDLPALLDALGARGIGQLMVEGGSEVLSSFLRAGLIDELTVFIAPMVIGGRTAPSLVGGPESPGPESIVRLAQVSVEPLGEGAVLTYRRPSAPL